MPRTKKKSALAKQPTPKKKIRRTKKVCNRCGAENSLNAKQCKECKSERFAPAWVVAKRSVNRQVSVEITKTNPQFGDVQERITLSKWWPGGRSSYHVPNFAQWEAIEKIINEDLGPMLGWKERSALVETVKTKQRQGKGASAELEQLVTEYPDFLRDVTRAINPDRLSKGELDQVVNTISEITNALSDLDAGFKTAFLALVSRLPAQGKRAIEDLEELLAGWSLHQINSVSQQVRQRLETIELFKKQIQDPRTYEIRGTNSIHRILERAMWLVDERYWLMHSNEPLRNFVGKEMEKRDKKRYAKKRPDFVCGSVGERLIIIEIKRPSHTLVIDDINQLETYLIVAERYKSFRSYEAYLVGNKKDKELSSYLKHRSNNFKVWTYSDLLESTERRYSEFIKATG